MQPATTERRTKEGTRVPLDLWIRLAHEDYEEPFDADGVDVSSGGLALRSEYLPEVGDRMRCQFESPPTGEQIEVGGEVVWAHDAGERSGEFGLRFGPLEEHAENSLREMVKHLGGNREDVTRLHLDGVASPIEAEILEQDGNWLTVEQELPFLQMGMGVTIEGGGGAPRGRLASVDLRVENGVPRLVLSVELDEATEESEGGAESTFDDDERIEAGAAETLDHELDDDGAEDDGAEDDSDDRRDAFEPGYDEDYGGEPDLSESTVQDYELSAELRDAVEDHVPAERDDVVVFAVDDEDEDLDEGPRDPVASDEPRLSAADRVGALKTRIAPMLAKTRERLGGAAGKARPMFAAAWVKVVAFFALVGQKTGPGAKAFFAKSKALFAKHVLRRGKRRKTAAPPAKRVAGARRRQQQADAPTAPKRNRRKFAALSALAVLGVGTTVYALTGDDEVSATEASVELPAAAAAPALPAPAAAMPVAVAPDTAATPAEAALPASTEAAPVAAPAPEGGRLGEPSFPTLRDADPSSAPVSEGQAFGAASVSEGRSATIRMSQPVDTLRGQAQEGGFTVTVPGALALDRAGPIAAANPSVERAMILNRGDHAVLTVRFVAGRTPDYRVVARGRAIEVLIGR